MSQQVPALRRERLLHLDALRGLAIVLMVLDHARVFFGHLRLEREHVASTTPALFVTRWVTHLCAPTFVVPGRRLGGPGRALYARTAGRSRCGTTSERERRSARANPRGSTP